MKNPTTKIAFLFGLYIVLHFVAACDPICSCPNVEFPFFDYRALKAKTNNPITDNALKIDISLDSVSFLVEAAMQRGSGFITSASACDCDFNGNSGDKFPVVALDVFADRNFNSLLPQDSSLISLFEINGVNISTDAPTNISGPLFGQFGRPVRLSTSSQPEDPSQPYVFTVRVIKSNMDTVSIQTDTIRFQ